MRRPTKSQSSSATLSGQEPTLTTAGLFHCLPSTRYTLEPTRKNYSVTHTLKMQLWALGLTPFFEGQNPFMQDPATPIASVILAFHSLLCPQTLASLILLSQSFFFVPLGIGSHVGQAGLKLCSQGQL